MPMYHVSRPFVPPNWKPVTSEVSPIQGKWVQRFRDNPPTLIKPPVGIIGFAGPAGVGKDTTAAILAAYLTSAGAQVKHESFAAPLYEGLSGITGIPVQVLSDQRWKNQHLTWPGAPRGMADWTPRELMQWLGTEVFREQFGSDFWINRFRDRAEAWLKEHIPPGGFFMPTSRASGTHGAVVIVSDLRFPNECSACDYVVEIARQGVTYSNEHASAKRLPDTCFNGRVTIYPDTRYDVMCGLLLDGLEAGRAHKKA